MAAGKSKSRFSLPAGLERSGTKRRPIRVADAIKAEIADILIRKIKDPRLHNIAITKVEVSDDLGHARVFYGITDDERPEDIARGLESAKGFIRSSLAKVLEMRYVPVLDFRQDLAAQRQEEMERLLREIAKEDGSSQ